MYRYIHIKTHISFLAGWQVVYVFVYLFVLSVFISLGYFHCKQKKDIA